MAKKRSDTYAMLLRVLHARERRVQSDLVRHRQQLAQRQNEERDAEELRKAYDAARFQGEAISAATLRTNQRFQERVTVLKSAREIERRNAESTLTHTLNRWQAINVSKQMMTNAHDRAQQQEKKSQMQKVRRSTQSRTRRDSGPWSMLNGSDE